MSYVSEMRALIGHRPLQLPGTGIIVYRTRADGKIEVLLQTRNDNGKIGLLGGGIELGESYEECASRELHEEAGLKISKENLQFVKVYAGKDHVSIYPNGDIVYHTIVVYKIPAEKTEKDESIVLSDETKKLSWMSLEEIQEILKDEEKYCFPNNIPIMRDIVNKFFK